MLKDKIELENDREFSVRYDNECGKRQKAFENAWDLREGFGSLGHTLFDGLVNLMEKHHSELDSETFGRKRFFRIVGPIRITLGTVKN